MTTDRTIDQDDILSMISCSEDYGFSNDVLISGLVQWARPITQADVTRFCSEFTTPAMIAKGYGEEDAENCYEVISRHVMGNGGFDR